MVVATPTGRLLSSWMCPTQRSAGLTDHLTHAIYSSEAKCHTGHWRGHSRPFSNILQGSSLLWGFREGGPLQRTYGTKNHHTLRLTVPRVALLGWEACCSDGRGDGIGKQGQVRGLVQRAGFKWDFREARVSLRLAFLLSFRPSFSNFLRSPYPSLEPLPQKSAFLSIHGFLGWPPTQVLHTAS